MTYPGELSLEDIEVLLVRAHFTGEIIPLYVFCANFDNCYWARELNRRSYLKGDILHYSARNGDEQTVEFPHENVKIFTNYWYAHAFALKVSKSPPKPIGG